MAMMQNVNTRDIAGAIRMGCGTIGMALNADDNYMPFFETQVRPKVFMKGGLEGDIPGRHLDALLNDEDAVGVALDEEVVDNEARALFFTYSGPLAFPLFRDLDALDGPLLHFDPHMPRQSLHGFTALVKYRNCGKASELAERTIATIFDLWDPAAGWNTKRLEALGLKAMPCGVCSLPSDDADWQMSRTFISGIGRTIGPLVEYYRVTGYGPALELAIVLKEKALSDFFTEDGSYDGAVFGHHCHSTTCVMSSLAQLADLTDDSKLMNRVRTFYDNGLWDIRDDLGWVMERSKPGERSDRGEGNNTGDIVETALILGRWGYTEYYHDAERILRGHLLACQLRDVSFIEEPPNPNNEDGKRDMANRHLGAFGCPAPYGHEPLAFARICFNMDVVGGVLGSLCEAYREVTRFDRAGHWINLLFDHETDAIEVKSPYTHPCLGIKIKRPAPLFVRISPWVSLCDVKVTGVACEPRRTNGYLFISEPPVNRAISIEFPLATQEITLKHHYKDVRARLSGDEVIAMDNFGADLTFFPPIE